MSGFDAIYGAAATKGSNPQDTSGARAFLFGNSFSVHVAPWLCRQVLLDEAALARPQEGRELVYVGSCRDARGQSG